VNGKLWSSQFNFTDLGNVFAFICGLNFLKNKNGARFSADTARSQAKSFAALVQIKRVQQFKASLESTVGTEVLKNSVALISIVDVFPTD